MIVEPAATPVTTPPLLIVATPVFDDVHGVVADGVPDPINVMVELVQTLVGPVIVGNASTVICCVF